MGRLEEARGKLDRALARLEQAAVTNSATGSDDAVKEALAASQAKCATLEAQSSEISERLDAAIERLQSVLKEDEKNGAG